MSTPNVNDFNVWLLQVPVVVIAGDGDFNTWDKLIPVVDQDEGNPNTTSNRRRPSEF